MQSIIHHKLKRAALRTTTHHGRRIGRRTRTTQLCRDKQLGQELLFSKYSRIGLNVRIRMTTRRWSNHKSQVNKSQDLNNRRFNQRIKETNNKTNKNKVVIPETTNRTVKVEKVIMTKSHHHLKVHTKVREILKVVEMVTILLLGIPALKLIVLRNLTLLHQM